MQAYTRRLHRLIWGQPCTCTRKPNNKIFRIMADDLKQVADMVTENTIFAQKRYLQVMRQQSIWGYQKVIFTS